jgi:hypothetical protein
MLLWTGKKNMTEQDGRTRVITVWHGVIRFIILLPILLGTTCKEEPVQPPIQPPEAKPQVVISLEDRDCTTLWFKVTFLDTSRVHRWKLIRDELPADSFTTHGTDTIIANTKLSPGKTYAYYVDYLGHLPPSDILQATTMDTTARNFAWRVDTLGGFDSELYDAAVITDDDIWVVGTMYISPGTPEQIHYNAAHWDGKKWNYVQIFVRLIMGVDYVEPLNCVYAFSSSDVWFSAYGDFVHWDGKTFTTKFHTMDINDIYSFHEANRIWGTSSNNLYIACYNGVVYHYNGNTIEEMHTPTDCTLEDIYGTPDGKYIYACGRSKNQTRSALVRYDGTSWMLLYPPGGVDPGVWSPLIRGVWVMGKYLYHADQYGIYRHNVTTTDYDPKLIFSSATEYYKVRGNEINNIFAIGRDFEIVHYNGLQSHCIYASDRNDGILTAVACGGNTVIAVGFVGWAPPRGIVFLGRR